MANEKVTCVGCAVSQFSLNDKTNYLVCNYSFQNIVGNPTYSTGPTGSQCTTGTNPSYPGLCSVNEEVNSNL